MDDLKQFTVETNNFLNRTTIMFGDSGDGKTTMLFDICDKLRSSIEQVFIYSGAEVEQRAYSQGFAPLPVIRLKITHESLKDLLDRQQFLIAKYNRAQNIDVLRSLFALVSTSEEKDALSKAVKTYKYNETNDDEDEKISIETKKEEAIKAFKVLVYKTYIKRHFNELHTMRDLTEEQIFCLDHIDFNPNLLIIFDDLTEQIVKFSKDESVKKIFFTGRWLKTTVFILVHSDKGMDGDVRKAAFQKIYLSAEVANACMKHDHTNGTMAKETWQRAQKAISIAFDPSNKFQKLIWVRQEREFYKYKARLLKPYSFGSASFWRYMDIISKKEIALTTDSKFH